MDKYEDVVVASALNYIDQIKTFKGIETALDEVCGEARANLQVIDYAYIGLPKSPEHPNGTFEGKPLDKYPEKRFFVLPNYLIGADWINPHRNANKETSTLYSFRVKHNEPIDVFVAYSTKNNYYVYSNDLSPPNEQTVFSDKTRPWIRVPEFILEKRLKLLLRHK